MVERRGRPAGQIVVNMGLKGPAPTKRTRRVCYGAWTVSSLRSMSVKRANRGNKSIFNQSANRFFDDSSKVAMGGRVFRSGVLLSDRLGVVQGYRPPGDACAHIERPLDGIVQNSPAKAR
jgi:hypothetical protein